MFEVHLADLGAALGRSHGLRAGGASECFLGLSSSSNLGIPIIAGWFISGKSHLEMDENWGYPISGNHPYIT